MKVIVWGSTETGRSSISENIKNHLSLTKLPTYKNGKQQWDKKTPVVLEDYDSFIMKALINGNLSKNGIIQFLEKTDKDTKHLLLYRQNLLCQFLCWYYTETKEFNHLHNFSEDEIDVNKCKGFINVIRNSTRILYDYLKDSNVYAISYEELFFNKDSVLKLNNLGFNFKAEHQNKIVDTIVENGDTGRTSQELKTFVSTKTIEPFSFYKNFEEVKETYSNQFIYIDNEQKQFYIADRER